MSHVDSAPLTTSAAVAASAIASAAAMVLQQPGLSRMAQSARGSNARVPYGHGDAVGEAHVAHAVSATGIQQGE